MLSSAERKRICDENEIAFESWALARGVMPSRLSPNGRPRCDFLLESGDQQLVAEVYTFFGSSHASPRARLINDMSRRLSNTQIRGALSVRLDTDHILRLAGKSRLAGASKEISEWIVSTIRRLGADRTQQAVVIPNAGTYSYCPLPERERLLVVGPSLAYQCKSKELLREALEKKGAQYKKSSERGLPYIIVLFCEYAGTDLDDVGQALYGNTKVTWKSPQGNPASVWTDAASGFFRKSRNRDVCGLLVALRSVVNSYPVGEFGFFENPWAHRREWVPIVERLSPLNVVGLGNEPPSRFGALTTMLNPEVPPIPP